MGNADLRPTPGEAVSLSVALCTYNGAAYLDEQLASIAGQDRLPDELVVCDDASTDATPQIVAQFAARVPFAVRWQRNAGNLGCRANFQQAIGLCRGQIIALADQDDVWLPHKLRRLAAALDAHPAAGFAFSDAVLVDARRRSLGCRLWQAIRFNRSEQRRWHAGGAVDVLLRHNVVTGATLAFRAEYRRLVLPIPDGWVHDGWLALLLAAVTDGVALAEPLIEYRQHAAQQIGERRRTLYEQYLRGRQRGREEYRQVAENYQAARDRLASLDGPWHRPHLLAALERKSDHFRSKASMRTHAASRLTLVLRELTHGHYARYSTGWRSLAQDLFC
jgi:glycosyltransferase involved in cell wall biosynthesis